MHVPIELLTCPGNCLSFGRDGVLRRKHQEAQHEVVSCLNRPTNAVVVRSAVYVQ